MSRCDSIEWSDVYVLGDEKIDSEHKKLFKIAQKIKHNKDSINLKDSIKELVNYTKVHFAHEELYMKDVQYVKLAEHKKIHRDIVSNLQNIIKNFDPNNSEKIYNNILDFVKNGLVLHIMIEDKKVQHFIRNRMSLRNMFTWKDDYLLGDKQIDDDHKKLFMIAFKAFSHKEEKEPREHIKKVIQELNKYMKEHFEREEEFMESISFPILDDHKIMHDKIITQINDLIKRIPTMSIKDFEKELLSSIDIWLVNHIVYEDQKIMCYLEAKKEKGIDLDEIDIGDVNMNIVYEKDVLS